MTVQKLRPGRPWCRIVMNAGRLDHWSISLCRRVIDGQHDVIAHMTTRNLLDGQMKKFRRHPSRTAPESLQEVVVMLPVIGDSDYPQPARHRPPTARQQHARNDGNKVLLTSEVKCRCQDLAPVGYNPGQRPCSNRGTPSRRKLFQVKQFSPGTPWLRRPFFTRRSATDIRFRDVRKCSC